MPEPTNIQVVIGDKDISGNRIKSQIAADLAKFYYNKILQIIENGGTIGGEGSGNMTAEQIAILYEGYLNVRRFTDVLLSKLNGIETGATADQTALEIANLYEGLTDVNRFTDSLKDKLINLQDAKFLGVFSSLSALQGAAQQPAPGSYAYVDTGVGSDLTVYIWDDTDNEFQLQQSTGSETPLSIRAKLDSLIGADKLPFESIRDPIEYAITINSSNFSLDIANKRVILATLNSDTNISAQNKTARSFILGFLQDDVGGRTVTFNGNDFLFTGGIAPNISSDPGSLTVLTGVLIGGKYVVGGRQIANISDIIGLQDFIDNHTHTFDEIEGLEALSDQVTTNTTVISNKADLVNGFIPTSQIPSVAISDFLGSVGTQAGMLALTGQRGDWAIRTDTQTVWIIIDDDSSDIDSWQQFQYPQTSSSVASVNGQTGTIVLAKGDVGLGAVPNIDATQRGNHTGTQLSSTISDFALTVRSTVLTGLSTATNVIITAGDSILGALGKVQAQISSLKSKLDTVETNATADQTALEIKAAIESLSGTNRVDASAIKNMPAAGVTDHGQLTGLTDDDHTQYLNQTRADIRYYTKAEIGDPETDFKAAFLTGLL